MKQFLEKCRHLRFRVGFLHVGSLFVILVWMLCDPELGLIQNMPFGAGVAATLIMLAKVVIYLLVLHWGRRAVVDYVDLSELYKKCTATPESSGYTFIGVGLIFVAVSICILAAVMS